MHQAGLYFFSADMDSQLKAYLGHDEDEGKVVFADSKEAAERLTDLPLRRAEEYDGYASLGYVPYKDLFEKFNWSFECHHCGTRIDEDLEAEDEELEEWRELRPVFIGRSTIYCCPECNDKENAEQVRQLGIAAELKAGLLAGWPGVTPGLCAVLNTPPWIDFKFPGCKVGGQWILGEPHVGIRVCDLEAWDAFKAAAPTKEGGQS